MYRKISIGLMFSIAVVVGGPTAHAQFRGGESFGGSDSSRSRARTPSAQRPGAQRPSAQRPSPWEGRSNNDSVLPLIIGGIETGIRELERQQPQRPQRNNRPNINNNYDYDDGDYYRRPANVYPRGPSSPTYSPPPPPQQQVVKPKANTKPPEKRAPVRANQRGEGLALLSDAERALADKIVEQDAKKKVDELETSLGDAAKRPEVQAKLDEAKQAIADGEPLDPNWADDLRKTVSNTGGLPPGVKPTVLDKEVDDLSDFVTIHALLQDSNTPNGGGVLPSGPIPVVTMPYWPGDEIRMLPDGCILLGTDGEGEIGIQSLDAQDVLGHPIGVGDPIAESALDIAKQPKSGVYIINPESTQTPINYMVGNANYEMKSGFSQALPEGQAWVISFDRGEGQGAAAYTLSQGTYAFGAGKKGGWDLFKQTFAVTIDNHGNDSAFYYNIDNLQQEVGPGQEMTHTSSYPILVRFDRGDGSKESQKRISDKSARLIVAASPKDGFWDLYPPDSLTPAPVVGKERPEAKLSSKKTKGASRAALLRALLQKSAKN